MKPQPNPFWTYIIHNRYYRLCGKSISIWINVESMSMTEQNLFMRSDTHTPRTISQDVFKISIFDISLADSGHNGQKPKRPKPKRPQTETDTNRNGHKPERPQTETATNRNGHRPERPQTETATNRKDLKPERPQIEIDTTIYDSAGYKFVCLIEVSN